jgi:hypothetical protein
MLERLFGDEVRAGMFGERGEKEVNGETREFSEQLTSATRRWASNVE